MVLVDELAELRNKKGDNGSDAMKSDSQTSEQEASSESTPNIRQEVLDGCVTNVEEGEEINEGIEHDDDEDEDIYLPGSSESTEENDTKSRRKPIPWPDNVVIYRVSKGISTDGVVTFKLNLHFSTRKEGTVNNPLVLIVFPINDLAVPRVKEKMILLEESEVLGNKRKDEEEPSGGPLSKQAKA